MYWVSTEEIWNERLNSCESCTEDPPSWGSPDCILYKKKDSFYIMTLGRHQRRFILSETLWNCLQSILLIQELNFKKIPSENIFSSWRKIILKNDFWKKIETKMIFSFFEKSIFSRKKLKKWIFKKMKKI